MTLEFRILGPLEVSDETGHVALGGPRQRGLLAILVLEAGRVVADRSADRSPVGRGGAEDGDRVAPERRRTPARALGSDVLETRSPGYVLSVEPDQIDARRFEHALADARRLPRRGAARLLQAALALWRGPALAEFAFDDFAQAEIRRLEELRLSLTGSGSRLTSSSAATAT